jgi:hypothetical protein
VLFYRIVFCFTVSHVFLIKSYRSGLGFRVEGEKKSGMKGVYYLTLLFLFHFSLSHLIFRVDGLLLREKKGGEGRVLFPN